MKLFLFLFFFTSTLFSLHLSNTLPKETTQIINSFDCFSNDDKIILTTYVLALKHRMEHLEDRDALVKSNLDYWRLWHLASDIESECALDYKFDDIFEETITPTNKEKKILKKLRRVEGGIRTDGSSEFSAKMSKYDAKLRKKILLNPPKYKILKKNKLLQDYNLTTLKHYTKASIPKNIYDWIQKQKLNKVNKDLLMRYAFLQEEMIRKYDKPKKRHKIKQEMIYLNECQKYENIYLQGDFYQNFKRKLANRSVTHNNYYPLKQEFLPKEIEAYCEHNITKMELTTFVVKKDKTIKKKKRAIRFKNAEDFIKNYKGNTVIKDKMKTYLNIVTRQIEGKGDGLTSGLRLVRLDNCFKKEDTKFVKSVFQDIEKNNLQEKFTEKVLQPQMWWMMTIGMKIDSEGESKELKSFFDCNQTSLSIKKPYSTQAKSSTLTTKPRFSSSDMRNAIAQKDSILKYYAKVFERRPTPNLNNKKAIKAGIISKKWIDKKGDILTPFGNNLEINGMPKGGIKLTYTGIPKGDLCTQFIQLNKNNTIHFNRKTYDGLDYIRLNNHKINLNHYVYKHVERLCNKEEDNITISFVKENTIREHKFSGYKDLDSAFNNIKKIKSLDNNRYHPYSFAYVKGSNSFVIVGSEAKLYSIKYQSFIKKLPRKFENSYDIALSPDGTYLAVGRYGTDIHIWNMKKDKLIKTIKVASKDIGRPKIFLSDNKTLVLSGEKIHFLDIETEEIIAKIEPRFLKSKRSFSSARITAIAESPDSTILYIGGNKNKIERWSIKKGWLGSRNIKYIDYIEDKEGGESGALLFDPKDKNILIIGSKKTKIRFWNIKEKKTIKTYIADEHMNCGDIKFSDDYKYMLAIGTQGVFLWKLNNKEQYDIIKGDNIVGGIFLPNSHKFITMDRKVSVWEIK